MTCVNNWDDVSILGDRRAAFRGLPAAPVSDQYSILKAW
ncbi:hypothetical protein FB472_1248 [Rhodoglobus vestalii]|uniref:Uncharacterized protein n=1 Tax=Rhodoglobus vestalii TaxID=193384 RepID=A0A8H2K8L8_9MICO|nr:hypothetical protein FB472_1248 [Rhodoglobus vestalii]